MESVIQWYKDSLVSRMNALTQAREALQKNQSEVIPSLRRLAHSLKGSGGTYGFIEITEAAKILEEAGENDMLLPLERLIEVIQKTISSDNKEKTGILLIDDDKDFTHIIKTRLANPHWEIYLADNAVTAEEILSAKSISLIILDLILADMDGRQFLVQLKERVATAQIPVIILTAKSGNQTRTECLALGAEEFYEKPMDPEILSAAIASRLRRTGEMQQKMHQDPLTQLLNRAAFCEAFERSLSLSLRHKQPLAFALLDFDRFKTINDTYGHGIGDEVLRGCAQMLSNSLRKSDVVGRWGGEEFVVLFPGSRMEGAREALQNVLYFLREKKFQAPDKNYFSTSFSAGVIQIVQALSVTEAVAMADQLLYLAKENGGHCIQIMGSSQKMVKKQILIAEDDESIVRIVKENLGEEGFEVLPYADGSSAWNASAELKPVLVILDVKMPGMDGFELLNKLRNVPYYHTLPIIMLTSMGKEKDIIHGFELGADDYILKPFSPAELKARVRRLLKRQER